MNKLLLALLVAFSAPVFAGTQAATDAQLQQQQTSASNSDAAASNAGNTQAIIFNTGSSPSHTSQSINQTINSTSVQDVNQTISGETTSRVVYSGTQTVKNVPSVSGPPLTSSNDTCMGSVSGSLNVAGFGGSYGSTYKDDNCVMLKNGRELWNMGLRGAALARLCMDADNREAMELTGFECPQTTRDRERVAAKK